MKITGTWGATFTQNDSFKSPPATWQKWEDAAPQKGHMWAFEKTATADSYVSVTETAGAVSAVDGPAFATSLPAPSGGTAHYPLATSDGLGGLKQVHTGPLQW